MTQVRVRFAPSPTGFVHIGGLRTALYNYLFARSRGGAFILRIEDTDRERFVEGAVENLIAVLEWAGLVPDEGPKWGGVCGPYFQSERTETYRKYALELLEKGFAYYSFDTAADIEAMRQRAKAAGNPYAKYNFANRLEMRNSLSMSAAEVAAALAAGTPHTIRLLVPAERKFEIDDLIRGHVVFDSKEVDDQVLLKSDGYPTYHLANVVDDHLMEITHVIRGEEWLSSVPKHLLLYEYFGWQPPQMAHLPLIFNPDGSKMSKRDIQSLDSLPTGKVDPDVASYIRKGYEKAAILNYIALLGWNPGEGDERQVFTLDELVQEFSLERINKSAAIFDLKKLNWINKEHIMRRTPAAIAAEVAALDEARAFAPVDPDYLQRVTALVHERLHFLGDFWRLTGYFFRDPESYEPEALKKRWDRATASLLTEYSHELATAGPRDAAGFEQALRTVAERHSIGGGALIHPVRLAVTGVSVGPGLFELLAILGTETVQRRLSRAVAVIPSLPGIV
ncbi:MAG TPA: glutamate--tRNA ligase [bacterium]|nr:glutamate--tRNA ligase [bacterium]HPR86465.1 glutamate--tRNA ligase [bacterium]